MKNKKKKGFTLVELLVVIAILAVLASVTVVGYMGFTDKARESTAKQEVEQVETAIIATLADGEVHSMKITDSDTGTVDNDADNNYLEFSFKIAENSNHILLTVTEVGSVGIITTDSVINVIIVDKLFKQLFELEALTNGEIMLFKIDEHTSHITYSNSNSFVTGDLIFDTTLNFLD